MASRPVTHNFRPLEASHVEMIRLRREASRVARSLNKTKRKIKLNRPTKAEKLVQASGLDQTTANAVLAALKNMK